MSLPSLVLLSGVIGLGGAAAFRYRNRWYAALAGAAGFAIATRVALGQVDVRSMAIELSDVPVTFALAYLAAELFGLPRAVAVRTGIGLKSPEWEFDRALIRLNDRVNRALEGDPRDGATDAYARWRERFLADASRSVADLRSLRPPDRDWGELAEGYALLTEAYAASYRDGVDRSAELARRGTDLLDRWNALRRQHREARRQIRA